MTKQNDDALDSGLVADIPRVKKAFEERAQFHWEYYSELALLGSRLFAAHNPKVVSSNLPPQLSLPHNAGEN